MASYEQTKLELSELFKTYPNSLRIIANENDVDTLNFDKVMEKGFKEFFYTDDNLISYLKEKLKEGCEIAIQPSGKYSYLIIASKGLFKF
ncbi:MAG: hypothetical protein R2764_10580 [Bacteroidales bacterium]